MPPSRVTSAISLLAADQRIPCRALCKSEWLSAGQVIPGKVHGSRRQKRREG